MCMFFHVASSRPRIKRNPIFPPRSARRPLRGGAKCAKVGLEAGCLVSAVGLGCLPSAVVCGGILHRTGLLPLIGGGLLVAALGVLLASAGLQHLAWMIAGLSLTGLGLGAVMAV